MARRTARKTPPDDARRLRAGPRFAPALALPSEPTSRCRYVAHWVSVKARWWLAMDERERVAMGNILAACAGG